MVRLQGFTHEAINVDHVVTNGDVNPTFGGDDRAPADRRVCQD